MYTEFRIPPRLPGQRAVWRYMDFPKFVSLLLTKSVFFTRLDRLADDPWEGLSAPKAYDPKFHLDHLRELGVRVPAGKEDFYGSAMAGGATAMSQMFRQTLAVSCWHMSEGESVAMWRIYAGRDSGIAIRTTYDRIKRALHQNAEVSAFLGLVNYSDDSVDGNPIGKAFIKRTAFSAEREFRAAIMKGKAGHQLADWGGFATPTGELVAMDPSILVEEVLIAPWAHEWFVDTVRQTIEHLGFQFPCTQSSLLIPPIGK